MFITKNRQKNYMAMTKSRAAASLECETDALSLSNDSC